MPSSWELPGHGVPIYTNIVHPFPRNSPVIDHAGNPVGIHLHILTAPSASAGREV